MAIVIQPKFDGMRLVIHRKGNAVKVFTEDKKRDRAAIFPPIVEECKSLPEDQFILDTEFVEYQDGKALPREDMMWMIVGKESMGDREVKANVHDCLWYGSEAINELPYAERLKYIDKLLPASKKLKYLQSSPSWLVSNRKEFDAALQKAYNYESSEGAMLKAANSQYLPDAARTADWSKIKAVKEISVEIIGMMRKAMPWETIGRDQPKENIEGEEALKLYKRLQEKSKTWIFRCALKEGKGYIPIETADMVTPADLEVKWNAGLSKPKWQGLDNPALWEMKSGFKHREAGERSYGATYAKSFAGLQPKLGDIITVAPVQLLKYVNGDEFLAWMFPKVREQKPERRFPDDIKDLQHLIEERQKDED